MIKPERTKDFIVPGDDRYERALKRLEQCSSDFSISDAFHLLYDVRQEGVWATRVSFVYSAKEQTVYYTENNQFEWIQTFSFPLER